ncbi:hypothetical protein V1511DRAFT_17673 [Dipodascopsis uninucleata]
MVFSKYTETFFRIYEISGWNSLQRRWFARPKDLPTKKPSLTLAHFIHASQVRNLWRQTLRAIKKLDDQSLKAEMKTWARGEFESHKNEYDIETIKYHIATGRKQLEMMTEALHRSGR